MIQRPLLHNSNSFTWFNGMIELLNIPRRFLESSPLAQGCVLYILKVFIKRAARVAGKVLCFVIVPLPVFFHLKLHILNFSISDHKVITRVINCHISLMCQFQVRFATRRFVFKEKLDASNSRCCSLHDLIQLFRNKCSWLYLLCHCWGHSIGVGLDPRVKLEKILYVHGLLADQGRGPGLSFIGHRGHLDTGA